MKNYRMKYIEVQKRIMDANAQLKFVEPENLHFTLKFLGEISDTKAEDLTVMIENKIRNYKPFKLSIKGTGFFPNPDYIRVIWLGVEDPETILTIADGFR